MNNNIQIEWNMAGSDPIVDLRARQIATSNGVKGVGRRWPDVQHIALLSVDGQHQGVAVLERSTQYWERRAERILGRSIPVDETVLELSMLAVDFDMRHHGYGRQLTEHTVRFARQNNITLVSCTTLDCPARHLLTVMSKRSLSDTTVCGAEAIIHLLHERRPY